MADRNRNTEAPADYSFSELEAYRLSLAAVEAERARLLAKYDARIKALKKAIRELESQQVQPDTAVAPIPPSPTAPPQQARRRRSKK
jgi:DnaJ-domain-containing protein 1